MSNGRKRSATPRKPVKKRAPSVKRQSRARDAQVQRPVKLSGKKIEVERKEEHGPLAWIQPMLEATYTDLTPRGAPHSPAATTIRASSVQPSGGNVLAAPAPSVWRDILLEYKSRKAAAVAPVAGPPGMAGAPFVPGARNWLPLGPSVVMEGQTVGSQPVAGRVASLAIAPGGNVIYAATANGGVFRSNDGATTWQSLMDNFDLDPTNFASASLVCGAVAIDPADPARVYVGTGEGDTLQLFRSRVTGSLPAYRGVGVIRSDDAGSNWISETSSPDLAGEAFFALAVDPGDRENVVGGTTNGLYRRLPLPGGQFEWKRVRTGVHASVVGASRGAIRRFFCAEWGQPGGNPSGILHSDDGGATWIETGTGFPTTGIGRIALAVQGDNPDLVYAFATTPDGKLQGLFRLDGIAGAWKKISGVPNVLPGGQGAYDLGIAVDPADTNLVYLAGDHMGASPWAGSVWRCEIKPTGSTFKVNSSASIGTHAHSDVHFLMHTPGTPDELWCACDGGVFLNRNPRGAGEFAGQNNGLACLCCNFIAQHPTDPGILFSGLQDNGTARAASGPIWKRVGSGDGGYCLINWADPKLVLAFANGSIFRSTNGGASTASWPTIWEFDWATMTQPIVGAPFNPASPADAKIVAAAAGQQVSLSNDFAASWATNGIVVPGGGAAGDVFALAFASPTRLFIGTTRGRVFRADRSGTAWTVTRIDNVAAGPLGLTGLITDIAVDWADATLSSAYIAFGGMGDRRRVWWFNGTTWADRSGTPGGSELLDVEHNALAVDPAAPNNIYAGADIGVWHSADGGLNWDPLQNGLPDAPVFDLQIHPTQRLLRVATHGRGVYEIPIT